jgi:hypothetical protein
MPVEYPRMIAQELAMNSHFLFSSIVEFSRRRITGLSPPQFSMLFTLSPLPSY